MIEYRAVLRENMKFEGGFKLKRGTYVYVSETSGGWWMGTYYEPTGSAHAFNLEPEQFSILRAGDIEAEQIVWVPDPPEPEEDVRKRQDIERRRLESRIQRHREQADLLERLLTQEHDGAAR